MIKVSLARTNSLMHSIHKFVHVANNRVKEAAAEEQAKSKGELPVKEQKSSNLTVELLEKANAMVNFNKLKDKLEGASKKLCKNEEMATQLSSPCYKRKIMPDIRTATSFPKDYLESYEEGFEASHRMVASLYSPPCVTRLHSVGIPGELKPISLPPSKEKKDIGEEGATPATRK